MSTTSTKPLSAAQVRKWADAEVKAAQAKAAADEAYDKAKEYRKLYRDRMLASTDPEDAGKAVLVAEAGGWRIRLTTFTGGERFSLSGFRKAGHKITKAMAAHITAGGQRERVTVKRVKGPTRPGAVEPA